MSDPNFQSRFNSAIKEGNWSAVKVMGEAAVAEYSASKDVFYNLGLGYLKSGDPAMAVAVLLATPRRLQDQQYRDTLNEALRMTGHGFNDLELGTHGLEGLIAEATQDMSVSDLYAASSVGLGVSLMCIAVIIWQRRLSNAKTSTSGVRLVTSVVAGVSSFVTSLSLILILISSVYQSTWGAVVSSEGSLLRKMASQDAESVKTLKSGQPVVVLGDTTKPWLEVLDSTGDRGWVSAIDVRCIRVQK